jgi:hypothetical protein
MTFTGILIPLVGGILLVAFPGLFTKATGEALNRAMAKLRRIGYVLLGVAGIYCVVKVGDSFARPDAAGKPQMEMHRVQAETPGDSGWYLGESTHGSFAVQIPIPFNDFTLSAKDPKLGIIRTYCIGAQSSEGLKFGAIEAPFVQGMSPPDLDAMPLAMVKEGLAIKDVDKAPHSGWPSVSFSVSGRESGAYVRYVRTPSSLITLTLEYPVAWHPQATSLKSRFLDSLRVKVPNPQGGAEGRQSFRLLTSPGSEPTASRRSP